MVLNRDGGFPSLLDNLVRPVWRKLDWMAMLDFNMADLATNQTLRVKDSVFRVGVERKAFLAAVADTEETGTASEP